MNEDISEATSLHQAILNNDVEKVKLLIKGDTDLNLPDSKGLKPMHVAMMTNNIQIVTLLCKSSRIEKDITDIQLAIQLNSKEILKLLGTSSYHNFKMIQEMKNSKGETLVHYCVRYRSIKILSDCIQFYKTNINEVDIYGYSPLHLAIINNDTKIVGLLLKSGADVHAKTLDGRSSIHFAVEYQSFETLLMLIDSNVDVNDPITSTGSYPLHIAVQNGDESTVNLLIRAGGDIHCKNKDGKNILHIAVESGQEEMVNMLFKKGMDVNARFGEEETSVLELALISKNSRVISAVLNYNPDLNSKNKDGLSALFIAMKYNSPKTIQEIFLLKPDLSAVTNDNVSLLHYALIYKVDYITNYLLENDININVVDNEGRNALHYAAEYSDAQVVSQLISKGINVNSRTLNNKTPLHFASERNCDLVEILLNNGANINAQDILGQTPLIYSIDENDVGVIKLLLNRGANVNYFDNEGNTPFCHLISNYCEIDNISDLFLMFINLGANINKLNNNNDNIFHIFLKNYNTNDGDIINLFLDHGANINGRNNNNQTPLEVCLEQNNHTIYNIVTLLIDKNATMNKTKAGENALHLAVKKGRQYTLLHLLKRNNTDVNDTTVDGSTVLHYAIKYNNKKICQKMLKMLLVHKINTNVKDKEGKTPLHLAVIKNSIEIVLTLLSNKADINVKDVKENSPLCYAILNKNLSIIKLLLQKGACTSDTHGGLSIYDLAEKTGDKHVYHMVMFFFKNN